VNSALLIPPLQATTHSSIPFTVRGEQKRASPLGGTGRILIGAENGVSFRGGARQRVERIVLPIVFLFSEARKGMPLGATLKETLLA
jgi:hypothetical protein